MLIALQYPNGRIHETTVDLELKVGDRFELYGREWAVQGRANSRLRRDRTPLDARMVCVPAGSWPTSSVA
jgi:hypothetical protein